MKIVVAVDGSKYGRWATEWVVRLPLVPPLQVTALHVVDTASLRAPFMVQPVVVGTEPYIREEIKRLEAQGKQVAAETKALLSSFRMEGKVRCEEGAVAPTILKRAGRNGLIAIGHRGLDALDRFMLGSVSTNVTLHAPCPVLVVKQPPRPLRRILLATDGSKPSQKALQFVLKKMRPQTVGANEVEGTVEVAVMHVMPFLKYPEVKEQGRALVHYYADKLAKAGYRVEEIARLGHPADEIMKVAERRGADLIVCGAKGLGAVARFFLGSVSTKLVQHSACSVLVVR
ncbi:MAG: universal stress protein [Nitrospira sp.]|nr:universal stress protein [Nitrospira sp.]